MTQSSPTDGPPGWRNWRAHQAGAPKRGAAEYPLYSDSHFRGEILTGLGPYQFLYLGGAVFEPQLGHAFPVVALRADWHAADRDPSSYAVPKGVELGSYHGGWIDDELAALLGLALDVRCSSGGMWRDFGFMTSDPQGRGNAWKFRPPTLVPPAPGEGSVIPNVARSVNLADACELLALFPEVAATKARGLARAARSYQRALWIADDDPRLAWLYLFGAVEAAAHAWSGDSGTPREQVADHAPDISALLDRLDSDVAEELAARLAQRVGVGSRIRRFVAEYCPPAPQPRSVSEPIDWTRMNKHVRELYARRSEDVHRGVPIPGFLCLPPTRDETGALVEAPGGLAVHLDDASWSAEAVPMLLWTFAYVVGGSLRAWWKDPG